MITRSSINNEHYVDPDWTFIAAEILYEITSRPPTINRTQIKVDKAWTVG